jgi:hypothetical protein
MAVLMHATVRDEVLVLASAVFVINQASAQQAPEGSRLPSGQLLSIPNVQVNPVKGNNQRLDKVSQDKRA